MNWIPRVACDADIPALEKLLPLSVRTLQAPFYTPAQMEAALGPVFGVDRQLIRDGTYFVVEFDSQIVGCGGWSKRQSLFGSDRERTGEDAELNPNQDPARVRAFFVHPDWSRQGIGRTLLAACEQAILEAGFQTIELVATLAGEPLYASSGYTPALRYDIELTNDLQLPVVKMTKRLERFG